jgi:hypothetical protein
MTINIYIQIIIQPLNLLPPSSPFSQVSSTTLIINHQPLLSRFLGKVKINLNINDLHKITINKMQNLSSRASL